jgi:integrase
MTLEQFVREKWEPTMVPLLKPSSARYYGAQLRRHILPVLGQRRLCDLSLAEGQAFLTRKRTEGLSGSSVHGIRTALSKLLQAAVKWSYLERNPACGLVVGDRHPVNERAFLMPEQVRTLLAALPEPCCSMVLILSLTGLRIGELLALRWKHVDFMHGAIRVREAVSEGRFTTLKTRSSRRDVPISEPVRDALLALHSANARPEDLVFASRVGTPISPQNLGNRVLRPTCRTLGLPVVGWHSFRHTHATLLAEVGESLKTAQAILGHSDLATTLNVYAHPIPESQRRAVERVAQILFPIVPELDGSSRAQKVN